MKRFLTSAVLAATLVSGLAIAEGDLLSETVPTGEYKMDPMHGYVTFTYSHLGLSIPTISFRSVDATLSLDADDPAASAVNVTIEAASINSQVAVFDEHLNSENWFDTETYPEVTFVSTGLAQDPEDHTKGTMTGDLTIKDITKPVTLDVTMLGAVSQHPVKQVPTVGVQATTTVLRSDFGLGAYAPAVGDEITITISGEFNQTEPAAED